VPARLAATIAFADDGGLGEGPVWCPGPGAGSIWWTDVHGRRLLRGDLGSGRVKVHQLPGSVASFVPRTGGSFLAARRGKLVTFRAGPDVSFLDAGTLPGPPEATAQINDGKCDPLGRFWVGSISSPAETRAGALWRVDADLHVDIMLTGAGISNGLGWSPAGDTFYYIDSQDQAVDAFRFDLGTGELGPRRRLIEVPMADGLPDGLAVDADGGIWVAMFFAGRVHRYTPDGVLDTVVEVPVPCPASLAFGGPGLSTLFITTGRVPDLPVTARFGMTVPEAQPLAGSVFTCAPPVGGLPVAGFAG
jgi:sugar lactone lactonase YvrE